MDYARNSKDPVRDWQITSRLEETYQVSEWVGQSRFSYHYNPGHTTAVDSVTAEAYIPDMLTWMPASKTEITWDANYEFIQEGLYIYQYMGMSIPMIRFVASYDDQDRLTAYVVNSFDFGSSVWSPIMRMMWVYDSSTTFEYYEWNAGDDEPDTWGHSTFTFDGQGRIQTDTFQVSSDSLNWANENQTTYTYHPHDTTTGSTFIYNMSHYLPATMINESFGYLGMLNSITETDWDGISWVNSELETFTWDGNDLLQEYLVQLWDANTWSNSEKKEYTYDEHGNNILVVHYYEDGRTWLYNFRETITWSQNVSNNEQVLPVSDFSLSVYPNPFIDNVEINTAGKEIREVNYQIYNLKGQLVKEIVPHGNERVVWNGKDDNFLKARSEGNTATAKILKIK
jgi:hypothetical protein